MDLNQACPSFADLSGTDLRLSNLAKADLRGPLLAFVFLDGTAVDGVDFGQPHMRYAVFAGVDPTNRLALAARRSSEGQWS